MLLCFIAKRRILRAENVGGSPRTATNWLSDSSRSNVGGVAIYSERVEFHYVGFNHTQEVL